MYHKVSVIVNHVANVELNDLGLDQ